MSHQIIPYNKQNINSLDIKAINKVIKSKFLTQGPKNDVFCNEIKKFTKSKYAVVLNSATSALHVACLSLNLKKMIIYGLHLIHLFLPQHQEFIVGQKLIL